MTPIRYLDFSGLLNANASDFIMPNNELTACKNVYANKIGVLEKVSGYSKGFASQLVDDSSVNFLHHYMKEVTAEEATDYLIAGCDSGTGYKLFVATSGADWSEVTDYTYASRAGSELSAVNFLGKAFIVGHKNGSMGSNVTFNSVDFVDNPATDTDLVDMPRGKYIVKYRDLLYVLNAQDITAGGAGYKNNRAYYCNTPVAGAITWTPATEFIQVGGDDGEQITGGAEALDKLIIFKRFSMWRWDESEVKQIAPIGCDSYRSIVKVIDSLYWFNREGFWKWDGGYPVLISSKIQPYIDAIDQTKLGEVVASIYDSFEYRAFIGTVTVEGIVYTNAWFCWNVRRETAYIRCTSDAGRSATLFLDSNKRRMYFGTGDGYAMKFADKIDGISSDNGAEIDSFFTTKALDYERPEDVKLINQAVIFSEKPQGMKMMVDADLKNTFLAHSGQIVKKNVEYIDFTASANRYKYKFSEKSDKKAWTFYGFVVKADVKESQE